MKKGFKLIIVGLALAVLLAVCLFAYNQLAKKNEPPKATASSQTQGAAPDFTVRDVNGRSVSLSDFKGKPVVINFWASWCYWCKQEMPDYNKLYLRYHGKGVVFLMVDMTDGTQETKSDGLNYVRKSGYAFSPYFDISGDAANKYAVSGIPESVFIEKDGTISATDPGAIDSATMEQRIKAIMK